MTGNHIAVVAPPLPGHWDPLKVLAAALTARGHRLTFLHMPDAARLLAGTPFGFEAIGANTHSAGALDLYMGRLAAAPSLRGFLPMLRATAAMSAMLLKELPAALERIGAEAVIADSTEAAGGMAARHLGLPYVTSITGLPLLRDSLVPPPYLDWPVSGGPKELHRNRSGWWVADRIMRPIRRVLDPVARAWGLDPEEAERGSPLLQVAQCPPALDFPRADLPPAWHYTGAWRASLSDAPELPDDGRPLVYCSLGSLQGARPELFAAMTGACADLGARALVATGGLLAEAQARQLPGDPIVRAYWPQPAILPRCTAAILHGGFNTVLDALGAGVPMVLTPLAFEQPGTAARVARTGAGTVLDKRKLGRARLRAALEQVLRDPRPRAAAREMARHMADLGGVADAADRIDRVLRAPSPSRLAPHRLTAAPCR